MFKKFYYLSLSLLLMLLCARPTLADNNSYSWIGSWATSPLKASVGSVKPEYLPTISSLENRTIRNIVHLSIGGDKIRVRLSNAFGSTALVIDTATVGIRSEGYSLIPDSLRSLTFAGDTSVSIPPGGRVFSDPVELQVEDETDLAISLHIEKCSGAPSYHPVANTTSFVSTKGDFTSTVETDEGFFSFLNGGYNSFPSWIYVTGVDVLAPENSRTIIAFGDSITDGYQSSKDSNSSYPQVLARRLMSRTGSTSQISVLNAGISGNRIVRDACLFAGAGVNAQARLDRDVLTQTGATWVILLEGINDISINNSTSFCAPGVGTGPIPSEEIIAGMKQIISRVHARGLKIYGCTLLPFKGATYYTDEGEQKRGIINNWIRNSGAFDAVIDFDIVMQDPDDPTRLFPTYDSGDNLHPSDAGYQAMADAIDLSLFDVADQDSCLSTKYY